MDYRIAVRGQSPDGALVGHPHFFGAPYGPQDTVYVSRRELTVAGVDGPTAGSGVFPRIAPALVLTSAGRTRSVWNLPEAFMDKGGLLDSLIITVEWRNGPQQAESSFYRWRGDRSS